MSGHGDILYGVETFFKKSRHLTRSGDFFLKSGDLLRSLDFNILGLENRVTSHFPYRVTSHIFHITSSPSTIVLGTFR